MLREYQILYLDNDIPINRSFYCNNGDIKSRGLEVHVLDNSQAKDCTGLTIKMIVKVPSGEMFEATVANGFVPPSLLKEDLVHFNDFGYNVIANQVHKKGKELGYWS